MSTEYNFQEQKVNQKANAQKIDNQHFDEALDLSGDGSGSRLYSI